MTSLLEGYRRFRAEVWPNEHARYRKLAHRGQRPETLVIACVDSRVDPQTVFGAAPGELLVVRNVANIVPPYTPDGGYHGTSAALEFGVKLLKVRQIAVLGHAGCGGVAALIEGAPRHAPDFIDPWMRIAEPALWPIPKKFGSCGLHGHFEREVVRLSVRNLQTFPWIAERERSGNLALLGFHFDIATGELAMMGESGFEPVESDPTPSHRTSKPWQF